MSDYNQRAAKGQAYNLAVMEAVKENKHNDLKYVAERFLYHIKIASLFQTETPETLSTIIKNPKILELITQLEQELNK